MGTNTRVVDGLIFAVVILDEFCSAKRCIVGMVACNVNTALFGPFLEGVLASKDFTNM
jgi:hypothetical protein